MKSSVLSYLVDTVERSPNKIAYGNRDRIISYNGLIKNAQNVSNAIKKYKTECKMKEAILTDKSIAPRHEL